MSRHTEIHQLITRMEVSAYMDAASALRYINQHGIVLAAAKGPVPNLVAAIVGTEIKGSWWAHPRGREIFAVLQAVAESDEILLCRLVNGKITYVHRRLWPALTRVADRIAVERLAQVREEHSASGKHVTQETPFPEWLSAELALAARQLTETEALAALAACNFFP